jgi:hypothetical protein
MKNDFKPRAHCWAGNSPRPQCWGMAACPAQQPKAKRRPSRPVNAERRAHRVVTAHGTSTVARPPASSQATRCGGTGRGSSSTKGGKRRERWYRWGHTEAVVQWRGCKGVVGQQCSGVSSELRLSAEVVAGAWSTGKQRGSEERRQFRRKHPGKRSSP